MFGLDFVVGCLRDMVSFIGIFDIVVLFWLLYCWGFSELIYLVLDFISCCLCMVMSRLCVRCLVEL